MQMHKDVVDRVAVAVVAVATSWVRLAAPAGVPAVILDRDTAEYMEAVLFPVIMVTVDFRAEDIMATEDCLTGGMGTSLFGEIFSGESHLIPVGFI